MLDTACMNKVQVVVLAVLLSCGAPPMTDRTPDDAGTILRDAGTSIDDAGTTSDDAGTSIDDAGTTSDDAGSTIDDAGSTLDDAGTTFDDAGTSVDDAGASTHDAGSTTVDAGAPPPTTALLRPNNPLPCADPAVVSEAGLDQTFFVFCTGMSHVWKTTDWVRFSDVRAQTTFVMGALSTNGQRTGAWWAPGVLYSPALQQYVMWVSVPDAQATNGTSGWTMRSLAVFTAPAPTGPWTFQTIALDAAAADQHYIDPFLFIDHDGLRYVYWKQYGGGLPSRIMGARVNAAWTAVNPSTVMEVMNGYGGPGTWEDNVRENPTVWFDAVDGKHHLLFSGGHWDDDSYATGHALSSCGPLCPAATTGGWYMVDSGNRGILQVVRSPGDPDFSHGGPGGAVFSDATATSIIYAAAAKSASGDTTRYLMRDAVRWQNRAPYVDTPGHKPLGY